MDRPYSKLEPVVIPRIFLATPMHKDSRIHGETAAYCGYVANQKYIQWGYTSTISPEMSRNTLIEDHIHNVEADEWTHVYFIDTDVVPQQFCLENLLALDADVCVGVYPLFLLNHGFNWSVTDMDRELLLMSEPLPEEPFETRSAGAGCLLVRREVLEDIGWPYFKMIYQPKWENDGNAIKSMEDMYFFDKVIDKGYKIIVNPKEVCKHYNSVDLLSVFRNAVHVLG